MTTTNIILVRNNCFIPRNDRQIPIDDNSHEH